MHELNKYHELTFTIWKGQAGFAGLAPIMKDSWHSWGRQPIGHFVQESDEAITQTRLRGPPVRPVHGENQFMTMWQKFK